MRVWCMVGCMLTGRRGRDMSDFSDWTPKYPDGLESVRRAVDNSVTLCGLDKKLMEDLLKGEWNEYHTKNSVGRSSKKIVIEYDINTN